MHRLQDAIDFQGDVEVLIPSENEGEYTPIIDLIGNGKGPGPVLICHANAINAINKRLEDL